MYCKWKLVDKTDYVLLFYNGNCDLDAQTNPWVIELNDTVLARRNVDINLIENYTPPENNNGVYRGGGLYSSMDVVAWENDTEYDAIKEKKEKKKNCCT